MTTTNAGAELKLPEETNIINLDAMASPTILSNIFGCNISLLYQDVNNGKLQTITEHSYREHIQYSRQYLIKNKDLKLEQEANKQRLREQKATEAAEKKRSTMSRSAFGADNDGVGMELMVAKTKQDIRVNMARELQIYVKTSIERGLYIDAQELEELVDPFLTTIRQSLLTIALDSEVAEKQVDLIMEQLFLVGTILLEDSAKDSTAFVDEVMNRSIDPNSIDIDRDPPRLL